ncbi:Carboxymuconolactone decarboxylase family protein [Falsiruegeria litorea R37]|uniref:Carboxymuconolactone decarboxylase family protein n=1 Tax=Falsiruegeria litorea R37 TaxID=1200284 RepID=A0A1Y5REC8_9RHOB|nr:carboxymuconolactone decarboxylase family protein [Falsiruegeria litorea]SLN15264.1 Carboxymuconolactone decarboxylase family protein [Falsiruegeria litorea R37]
MHPRLNPFATAPTLMQPMLDMEEALKTSPLDHLLIELVKLRVSQINGCAYCIHMHTHDARAHGESEDRMHLLNAWRESPLYSDKERAALAWAEDLTRIDRTGAPDATYASLAAHFDEIEQVALTLLITTINAWNRIAIGFATPHPVGQEASAA